MYRFLVITTVFIGFMFILTPASAHLEVNLEYLGLNEGDIIGSTNLSDPDIYIINEAGYKRLFVSPAIFGLYGHLRYENVKRIDDAVLDKMNISALFRNCEINDLKVYALEVADEDTAILHWVNITGGQAAAEDSEFFHKIFCINSREFAMYPKGGSYTALSQVPVYQRADLPGQGINETNLPLKLPAGFRVSLFTPNNIGPVRFMAFSPDGILFVSLPASVGLYGENRKDDGKIFALPDIDGNGVADETKTVLSGLHIPHGIAFYGGYLYVAEEGIVSRYPYLNNGNVGARQVVVNSLPVNGEHVSRTIGFSPSGKMYVSVGSPCNNCDPDNPSTAAILEFNADGTGMRVFAGGLRNAVGFVFHPTTGEIWATENSRDFLGDNLPPDEINIVRSGKNYGWPFCYGNKVIDPYYNSSSCGITEGSIFNLQAHSAPLGLRFIPGTFSSVWSGDLLVARHGSWNRSQPVGYDIVRLDVSGNGIISEQSFMTGWLTSANAKLGRPVDVLFGSDGALYVSDDKANVIYRVIPQ